MAKKTSPPLPPSASNIPKWTKEIRERCDLIDAAVAGATPTPTPPTSEPTRVCYFGYFGDTPQIVEQVRDHANLYWAYGWPAGDTAIEVSKQAKAAGMGIMLGVYGARYVVDGAAACQEGMEYFFQQCEAAGILDAVVALYPCDEPDVAGMSDAQVVGMVNATRAAAAKFAPIATAKVAVCYGQKGTPGIQVFDLIARNNYGNGPQVLPLLAHQRLMIFPGGANPWGENPGPFVAYAQEHRDTVWGVIPFIWQPYEHEGGSHLGIKDNGMADAYRSAGRTLTGRTG